MANFDKQNLKALKKQLKKQRKEAHREKKELTQATLEEQQEQHLFLNAMSGVIPLQITTVMHDQDKPKPKRLQHLNKENNERFHDPLSDQLEITEVDGEEILSFYRPGIQRNTFKKLRSGGYRISDELDLHGASLKQAKQILVYYLQEAVQFEGCCVRIIHGKGQRSNNHKPVLKTHVNHWLEEHERVLAFHSCKIKDGGTGAVYVLLKRQ